MKTWPVLAGEWLAGFALALACVAGGPTAQAQNAVGVSSVSAGAEIALTTLIYADDPLNGLMMVSKSSVPCQPRLGVGSGPRRPNFQKHPRKANPNPGKKNPTIPCREEPIAKMRRHGRGSRI